MYQRHAHEPPFKRIRVDRREIKDADLRRRRAQNDRRLKSIFESIFDRYEKDFEGIGDEIDLETGEIVVDNGHLAGLGYQRDPFGNDVGSDVDSKSEESEEHRTLGATIDVYDDDVIENGCAIGIASSSPRIFTPRMSAPKKHPTPRLAYASPLQLCYDYEDELGVVSTASHSLPPSSTVRHNPWLLQRSDIPRGGRPTSPTWATPDLPMSTPRHFHRRLNAILATRPRCEHSDGKRFIKHKTPIIPRRSSALNLERSKSAPDNADVPSVESQRHGQSKTMARLTSPCQSENDELGTPELSKGIPARDADRSRTEKRFTDSLSVGPSRAPTTSDSSHDLHGKKRGPEEVSSAIASPVPSRSSSTLRRSPPFDNSAPAKVVSQKPLENNLIQTIDSLPIGTGSLPSTEQTYIRGRRPKRRRRLKSGRFGARDTSEDMQYAIVSNLPAKDTSPRPPLKERLSECISVVREIPDSDSPLSSQPRFEPDSRTPPRVLDVRASDRVLSTDDEICETSSPDRDRAFRGDESPIPVMAQKHSEPQELRNETDHRVQTKVQDSGSRSCSVKVVIPVRKAHANIPHRSLDKSFLHDEGKADAVDARSRTHGSQESSEPHEILASKKDGQPGRPGQPQVMEIPDSQPPGKLLYHDFDTDVDLEPKIVPAFIVSDEKLERRSISNSLLMNPASSDPLSVPCTPTAELTTYTQGVDERQSHPLYSPNTPKPQSATILTLSELWDGSDDDLTILLSSAKPARRSKPVRSANLIRKSIVSDMATCGDDELA